VTTQLQLINIIIIIIIIIILYSTSFFFFENRAVYEIMRKNIVQPDRSQIIKWHGASALNARYIRLQTQTRNMQCLLRFNFNSGYTNTLQCCAMRVLLALYFVPVFCISSMMQMHTGFTSTNTHLIGRKYSQNKE